MTYLITFACYGTRVHGDEPGSVDRAHNVPGTRLLEPEPTRASAERQEMTQEPYRLDRLRRALVLQSVLEVCGCRGWSLFAAHVRTNHVHVVVEATDRPEKVLNALKAYASRALNKAGLDGPARRRWSRHGSTRYLWKREQVTEAIAYVAQGQGEPMARYMNEEP
jgi:REP element-mobilizing transposase RayT